jgi:hypothetical protein
MRHLAVMTGTNEISVLSLVAKQLGNNAVFVNLKAEH